MKKIIIPAIAATMAFSSAYAQSNAELSKQIKELQDKVETLEYSSYENYFSFSGRLENMYERIHARDEGSDTVANYDYLSSLFQLNIAAMPSDRLSFFGRLSMAKYWNDPSKEGSYSENPVNMGRTKNEPSLFVERAFMNYRVTDALTFSAGRLPTIDGSPTHLSMGQSSMGSYPIYSYNAILDGVALTHKAGVLGGTLTSRAVYTPFTSVNHNPNKSISPSASVDASGNKVNSHAPMIAVMADFDKANTPVAKKMNVMLQAVHASGVELAEEAGASAGALGYIYDSFQSDVEFDLTKAVATLELNSIFKSKFDFAAQVAWSKVKSKGLANSKLLTASTAGNLATVSTYNQSLGGVYTDGNSGEATGWAYLASARYNASESLKLGYEFVSSTTGAFLLSSTGRTANGFYGKPGSTGHHGYFHYKFDENLSLLTGYMYQQIDTQYGYYEVLGGPTTVNHRVHTGYTNLIATF